MGYGFWKVDLEGAEIRGWSLSWHTPSLSEMGGESEEGIRMA